MLQLRNETPFAVRQFVFADREGLDTLLVVAQATLSWSGERLHVVERQRPVPVVDECWDAVASSSVRYASEARLQPPGTDVIVLGEAHTPDLRPATACDVAVRVGPVRQIVRVVGGRVWRRGGLGFHASRPEPFTTMPLRYERAVGGPEEPHNPIGCGLRGGRSDHELDGAPLPNVENPARPLGSPDERPSPVGFGAIPPAWEPRRRHAGTYDVTWQRTRAPYLPRDFDPRFLHAASPGLVTREPLQGGEPVELSMLSPRGHDLFSLPACPLVLVVRMAGSRHSLTPQLVTVLLEPTVAHATLVWSAALNCDGRVLFIDEVVIGLRLAPTLGGL